MMWRETRHERALGAQGTGMTPAGTGPRRPGGLERFIDPNTLGHATGTDKLRGGSLAASLSLLFKNEFHQSG